MANRPRGELGLKTDDDDHHLMIRSNWSLWWNENCGFGVIGDAQKSKWWCFHQVWSNLELKIYLDQDLESTRRRLQMLLAPRPPLAPRQISADILRQLLLEILNQNSPLIRHRNSGGIPRKPVKVNQIIRILKMRNIFTVSSSGSGSSSSSPYSNPGSPGSWPGSCPASPHHERLYQRLGDWLFFIHKASTIV